MRKDHHHYQRQLKKPEGGPKKPRSAEHIVWIVMW